MRLDVKERYEVYNIITKLSAEDIEQLKLRNTQCSQHDCVFYLPTDLAALSAHTQLPLMGAQSP